MRAVSASRVVAAALVWRSAAVPPAGRALARTLVNGSEQERTMAGMALVQAGSRSVPVIAESVTRVGASVTTVRVLADIDDPAARSVLRRIAAGTGPQAELAIALLNHPPGVR